MSSKRKQIVKKVVLVTQATMIAGIGEDGESVQVEPGEEHRLVDSTAALLVKIKKAVYKVDDKGKETEEYGTAKKAIDAAKAKKKTK